MPQRIISEMRLSTKRNAVRALRHLHIKLPSLYPAIDTNAHTFKLPYCSGFYGVYVVSVCCTLSVIEADTTKPVQFSIHWYDDMNCLRMQHFPFITRSLHLSILFRFTLRILSGIVDAVSEIGNTRQTSTQSMSQRFYSSNTLFSYLWTDISYVYWTKNCFGWIQSIENRRCRLDFYLSAEMHSLW